MKCPKLGFLNHFGALWWEKIGKKYEIIKIEHSKLFWTTLVGKDWEKCEMTKIGCSESFWNTLVEKDWIKCEIIKIGHSE